MSGCGGGKYRWGMSEVECAARAEWASKGRPISAYRPFLPEVLRLKRRMTIYIEGTIG